MASAKSSTFQDSSQSRSRIQQVFGDKLKVEEKLHILDALLCSTEQLDDVQFCDSTYYSDVFSATGLRDNNESSVPSTPIRFCQLCDKTFRKQSDLRTHMASHLSLPSCVCEVCGRSFSHISNLIRHLRIHSGLKPFPCKACGKRFRQISALQQHKISHHNTEKIPCPALPLQCNKIFRTPVIARRHAYREHPNVLWESLLPVCLKVPERLKKQRCFYCRFCGEEFNYFKQLKSHISEHGKSACPKEEDENCIDLVSKDRNDANLKNHCASIEKINVTPIPCDAEATEIEYDTTGNEMTEDHCFESQSNEVDTLAQDVDSICIKTEENSCQKAPGNCLETNIYCAMKLAAVDDFSMNQTPGSTHIGCRGPGHRIGDLHMITSAVQNLEKQNFRDSVNHHFENLGTIERAMENFNNTSAHKSEYKDKQSERSGEDLIESSVGEMKCSSVTHDVNMGLCPDSPSSSLDSHQLAELQCSSKEENIQCSGGDDDDNRNQSSRVKFVNIEDNFQGAEPLILSFGDSYSALLKEIGIVEENVNSGDEILKDSAENGFSDTAELTISSFWDSYPTLLKEIENKDTNDVSNEITAQEDGNSELLTSQNTSEVIHEQGESHHSIGAGTGLSSNYVLSTGLNFTKPINQVDEIVLYVAQEDCKEASQNINVSESMCTDFRKLTPQADSENFSVENNIIQREKYFENYTPDSHLKIIKASVELNESLIETNYLSKQALVKETAEASTQEPNASSNALVFDNKLSKKRPNRIKRECPECGKVFFKGSNLTQHLGLHFSNMKSYNCDICNRSFSWKSSLNKHVASHQVVLNQFLCDICGNQYNSLDQVNQHKKRDHLNLRPHNCDVCSKSFFRRYDLLIHKRLHDDKKPYMCETCGKTFNHLSHVKRHEKVHQKEKTVASQQKLIKFK